MTSNDALRHLKSLIDEAFTMFPKWSWTKNRVPEAVNEALYYYSRLSAEDKQKGWSEICRHARFSEKVSEALAKQQGD